MHPGGIGRICCAEFWWATFSASKGIGYVAKEHIRKLGSVIPLPTRPRPKSSFTKQ